MYQAEERSRRCGALVPHYLRAPQAFSRPLLEEQTKDGRLAAVSVKLPSAVYRHAQTTEGRRPGRSQPTFVKSKFSGTGAESRLGGFAKPGLLTKTDKGRRSGRRPHAGTRRAARGQGRAAAGRL